VLWFWECRSPLLSCWQQQKHESSTRRRSSKVVCRRAENELQKIQETQSRWHILLWDKHWGLGASFYSVTCLFFFAFAFMHAQQHHLSCYLHLYHTNHYVIALRRSLCFLRPLFVIVVFWQRDWLWRADWVMNLIWHAASKPRTRVELVDRAPPSGWAGGTAKKQVSLSLVSIDDVNKKKKLRRCFIAMRLGLLRAIFLSYLQRWGEETQRKPMLWAPSSRKGCTRHGLL
jgi:hypothetical protein